MLEFITRITIYLASFAIAFYALGSVNTDKFIRSGRIKQAQILFLLVAMALGKLVAEFLMSLAYKIF